MADRRAELQEKIKIQGEKVKKLKQDKADQAEVGSPYYILYF